MLELLLLRYKLLLLSIKLLLLLLGNKLLLLTRNKLLLLLRHKLLLLSLGIVLCKNLLKLLDPYWLCSLLSGNKLLRLRLLLSAIE